MRKILYRKEPLAGPEYHPEVLRNGMTEKDVAKVQASVQEKAEEAKAAQRDANQTWRDRVASLIESHTLEQDRENGGSLVSWFSGRRFSDVSSIKAHFGKNLEFLRPVGLRYVAEGDLAKLAGIVRAIKRGYLATVAANKFLRIDESEDVRNIFVGWKPGRNYVIASAHEIFRHGFATISGRGRKVEKARAIAELCKIVWPWPLKELGTRDGSEVVNGREIKNVEIRLGI